MIDNQTCQRTKVDKGWNGLGRWKCGAPATRIDGAGNPVCDRCYNRWVGKLGRHALQKETGLTSYELKIKGLLAKSSNNPTPEGLKLLEEKGLRYQ